MRVLFDQLSQLLVGAGSVPGPRSADAGLSMDRRLKRRGHGRKVDVIRLDFVSQGIRLDYCMNIGMCSVTCPKDLDPKGAIYDLIEMVKAREDDMWHNSELI